MRTGTEIVNPCIESGRVIVANNLINYLNNFLRPVNHPIWGQI